MLAYVYMLSSLAGFTLHVVHGVAQVTVQGQLWAESKVPS